MKIMRMTEEKTRGSQSTAMLLLIMLLLLLVYIIILVDFDFRIFIKSKITIRHFQQNTKIQNIL